MAAMEWTEKRKMLATAVVGLLINAVLGYFLYAARQDFQAKELAHQGLRKKIQELEAVVKDGPARKLELDNLKLECATKEKMLPEENQVGKLIEDVSTVAKKYKCINKSVDIVKGMGNAGGIAVGQNYASDRWRTRWEADFFGFAQLMNEMEERFPRFVGFENLTITPKSSGMVASGEKHDITVDVVTYRYVPK